MGRLVAIMVAIFACAYGFKLEKEQFVLIGGAGQLPLQVVPMERSPIPNSIIVKIAFPREGEIEKSSTARSQVRLEGFPLGVFSNTSGLPPLRENKRGQTLRVIVDDEPYFSVNLDAEDSFNANLDVYRKTLSFNLPKGLKQGEHILRIYPVLSYGESLKNPNNFASVTFYKSSKTPVILQDLSKPYLTYNEPQGDFKLKNPNDPILLDFYVCNCTIGRDAYKVKLSIDGEEMGYLYQWAPYLIYGLSKGSHTIKMELVNPQNETVPGDFNQTERIINVK
jgi:hypothetical protein